MKFVQLIVAVFAMLAMVQGRRIINPIKASFQCGVCEMITLYAESKIDSNQTVTEIQSDVDSLCRYLPLWSQTYCGKFVSQYDEQLATYIVEQGTKELGQFCEQVHLC